MDTSYHWTSGDGNIIKPFKHNLLTGSNCSELFLNQCFISDNLFIFNCMFDSFWRSQRAQSGNVDVTTDEIEKSKDDCRPEINQVHYDRDCRSSFSSYSKEYQPGGSRSVKCTCCAARRWDKRANQRPTEHKYCFGDSKWESEGAKHK